MTKPAEPRPSLSVIIPTYNSADTIGATLASVAGQSVAPTEVCVYDDGSTDNSVAIARAWQDRLPIRIVEGGSNVGPAAARHAAIESTRTDLLALLDSDDVWFPDHLESMHAVRDATHDGLATADVLQWIPGRTVAAKPLSAGSPLPPPAEQLAWLLRSNRMVSCNVFSRHRYDQAGGFRAQFRIGEDWDLWIRMVRNGAVVVRPAHPTVLRRLRGDGTSTDDDAHDRIEVLRLLAEEKPFTDPAEQRAHRVGTRLAAAQQSLYDAYDAVDRGKSWRARVAGLKATRGMRSVAIRGAAMAVAPKTVARRRQAVRSDTDVWLKRYGSS